MRSLLTVHCLFLLASSTLAQEPRYRASTSEWALSNLRLVQFADDGLVHLSGKESKTVAATDLVALRREDAVLPEHPSFPNLVFASGERVPLREGIVWKENRLQLVAGGVLGGDKGKLFVVPTPFIALLCLRPPTVDEELDVLLHRLETAKRKSDLALLTNGDQVEGRFQGIKEEKLLMRTATREVALALDQVAVLAFDPDRRFLPRPKRTFFHVVLSDGARLDFAALKMNQEKQIWSGRTLGVAVEFPAKALIAVDAYKGKATYLSSLPPESYVHEPAFGFTWPLGKDHAFVRRPLRLADGTYDKGLSMPLESRVTYKLDGDYRWFEARVGLDPKEGYGRAVLQVERDGVKMDLGLEKELAADDPPLDLRLDISGAKNLTLRVSAGSRVGMGVVNWGGARLVK